MSTKGRKDLTELTGAMDLNDAEDLHLTEETTSKLKELAAFSQANDGSISEQNALQIIYSLQSSFEENPDLFNKPILDQTAACLLACTTSSSFQIREAAFSGMTGFINSFFKSFAPYFNAFANASIAAIQNHTLGNGAQAVEMWATLSDNELMASEDKEDTTDDMDDEDARESVKYLEPMLPQLLPVLVNAMLVKEEKPRGSLGTLAETASAALSTIAELVGYEKIEQPLLRFAKQYLDSSNDTECDAALTALAIIGPVLDDANLQRGVSVILQLLEGSRDVSLRSTAAWAIGTMAAEISASSCFTAEIAVKIFTSLCSALSAPDPIPHKACYAIVSLADTLPDELKPAFSAMILQALLAYKARAHPDSMVNAVEAANAVIRILDVENVKNKEVIFKLLEDTLTEMDTPEVYEGEVGQQQALQVGLIQTAIVQLSSRLGRETSDKTLRVILGALRNPCVNAEVRQEALLCLAALTDARREELADDIPQIMAVAVDALKTDDDIAKENAILVIGDVTRAIPDFTPYADSLLVTFLSELKQTQSDRLKMRLIETFGDIALSVAGIMSSYIHQIMPILFEIQPSEDATPEDMDGLSRSLFDAFIGIIQGLRGAGQHHAFAPYIERCTQIATQIICSSDNTQLLQGAVGFLGDVGQSFGEQAKPFLRNPEVKKRVQELCHHEDEELVETATWLSQML